MFKKITALAALVCSLTLPTASLAWLSVSHKLIAEIAYSRLNPCAQAKTHELIDTLKQNYPGANTIARASVLPDVLRHRGVKLYDRWHYIDIPYAADSVPTLASKSENIVWALNHIIKTLHDPNTPLETQAFYFSFLLHLVGDAHQPMHTISRFSEADLDGDKGGNEYPIHTRYAKNLHTFWDQGMNFYHGQGERLYLRPKAIRAYAAWLQSKYPAREWYDKVKVTDPERWVEQGYNIAKTFAYRTPMWQRPHPAYVKMGRQIIEKQVALAGYRLAYILNHLYPCEQQAIEAPGPTVTPLKPKSRR